MLQTRVIPILLLRNKGLVKTQKFDKAKYIGDPINAIKIFNDKEVDELVFLDIDASKKGLRPDFELIANIASECFMPLGYGGGISNIDDIKLLFSIGVEKVILNSAAIQNLNLVKEAADIFGGQSIVVSIDVKKNMWGKYIVFSHAKLNPLVTDPVEFAKAAQAAGAGEIMVNAVDRDGMMNGYDTKLIEKMCEAINLPVVASGGASGRNDFKEAVKVGASAVAAGSIFVYHGPHKAVLINYPTQSELKSVLS
ncbi:MAG: imidazole glycerol phosphate synthase subunit HisF [Bacteroidetes bacterium]|nr:imidazole glycerol phosphate synthase subunit HisF [Bacteroidota bacterium]